MSPVGRVFIVLNLVLAGTFVGFSGTFLQRQHNWKTEAEKTAKTLAEREKVFASEIERRDGDLRIATSAKSAAENRQANLEVELNRIKDENTRLETRLGIVDGEIKKMGSVAEANATELKALVTQYAATLQMAMKDQKDKDDAVRAKDAAEAENRTLKGQVAELNETVTNKDVAIAGLTKDKGELDLLVTVAKAKGFLESMAVPQLAGTVSIVQGRLCTIAVTDNPTSAEIKPGYRFAIYDDASGYKGEARVTSVDAERKAAFCTIEIQTGAAVKEGDKASTHLAGTH
jgi:hypothetical protein